jgi:hypothetical protein
MCVRACARACVRVFMCVCARPRACCVRVLVCVCVCVCLCVYLFVCVRAQDYAHWCRMKVVIMPDGTMSTFSSSTYTYLFVVVGFFSSSRAAQASIPTA